MIERCRRFGGFAGSAYGEPLDATMSAARLGFSPWISNGCHWRIYLQYVGFTERALRSFTKLLYLLFSMAFVLT